MKLVTQIALMAALGAAATEAATIRKALKLDTNNVDKKALLANARQKDQKNRKLQDNAGVSGRHSIVFKSCKTLSVNAQVEDNEDLQAAIEGGYYQGVKSFVEFDVCQSEYCGDSNSRTTYVTSLADYMNAFSEFLPTKQAEYCEACVELNDEYCQLEDTDYYTQALQGYYSQQQQQQQQRNNGGRRKLQQDTVYEAIDCDRCSAYECVLKANSYESYARWDQADSQTYIQNMAACWQDETNGFSLNGEQPASYGFICNENGNGVEIGVFADEECTVFAKNVAYGQIMGGFDHYMWKQSKANVEYIFDNSFSCYSPEVVYVGPDYDFEADAAEDQGDDYEPEAAEWCQAVFQGEVTPVAMTDCGTGYNAAVDGDSSYGYSLAQDDATNATAVCSVLTQKGGAGDQVYSKAVSGSMYSYSNSGGSSTSSNWGYASSFNWWGSTNGNNSTDSSGAYGYWGYNNDWQTSVDYMQAANNYNAVSNSTDAYDLSMKKSNKMEAWGVSILTAVLAMVAAMALFAGMKIYKRHNIAKGGKREPFLFGGTKVGGFKRFFTKEVYEDSTPAPQSDLIKNLKVRPIV